jgi:hypothetical protein
VRKIKEPLWQWHERKTFAGDMQNPEEWAIFLEADCAITIGDKEHVEDEGADVWGDMTIKEYFIRYINTAKEIERLKIATVTIESCVINRFDRVWDLKVIEGMTIFIESEEF